MKKITILALWALAAIGCNTASTTEVSVNQTANTRTSADTNQGSENRKSDLTVLSHSSEQSKPPMMAAPNSAAPSGKPAGESPMTQAVDVSELTKEIEKAEKDYKAKSNDEAAKKVLADAYFKRAFVLTKAAQYRAALGDFRKGLKLDPANEEAKAMNDQILAIFKSLNREPPKEGEEPAPLPAG